MERLPTEGQRAEYQIAKEAGSKLDSGCICRVNCNDTKHLAQSWIMFHSGIAFHRNVSHGSFFFSDHIGMTVNPLYIPSPTCSI